MAPGSLQEFQEKSQLFHPIFYLSMVPKIAPKVVQKSAALLVGARRWIHLPLFRQLLSSPFQISPIFKDKTQVRGVQDYSPKIQDREVTEDSPRYQPDFCLSSVHVWVLLLTFSLLKTTGGNILRTLQCSARRTSFPLIVGRRIRKFSIHKA